MATNYRQMFEKALLDNQNGGNAEMQQLEQQIMQKGTGANLAPTMGLVDHLSGSKLAGLVPQEASLKEKLGQVLQMRQQQQSKKLDGLGKLAQMQDAAEGRAAERAFKEKMFDLKKAGMLQKAMAKPKIGSEDKKALGFTTTLLKELPKLKALYEGGGGVARPGFVGSIMGQNNAEVLINALAENYGRLQSGGAINKDEEDRFKTRLGSMMDSPEIRISKLSQIMEEIQDKHGLYGGGDLPSIGRAPTGGSPSAGSSSKYDDLNDIELEMMFAQRGLR